MNEIQKQAFINSFLTSLYIIGIGFFLYFGAIFKIGQNILLAPIAFLFLFVFSASITSYLMLGRPVQLYIDGKKKDAVSLLINTLTFFCIFTLIAILLLIVIPPLTRMK